MKRYVARAVAASLAVVLLAGCVMQHLAWRRSAPDGFFTRPSFADVVAGEGGPDDVAARCTADCRAHHAWPDGRRRSIHESLILSTRDHEWADLSQAESYVDTSARLPSIPPLCPRRLVESRVFGVACRMPATWSLLDALVGASIEYPEGMLGHVAHVRLGVAPTDFWREPMLEITELGTFGRATIGQVSGEIVERRDSGAVLRSEPY